MDPTDMAITFEAVKTNMNQNATGTKLTLVIHPNDCPPQLHTDLVGARYRVVMVRIGDDEEPTASPETIAANRSVRRAALLCKNSRFQDFMVEAGHVEHSDNPEEATAEAMRRMLGIKSRSDIGKNSNAKNKFDALEEEFRKYVYAHIGKAEKRPDG